MFQSTRPHGARLEHHGGSVLSGTSFNPRARTGRDMASRRCASMLLGFNPRARTGRDWRKGRYGDILMVSIHAPARGATPHHRRRLPVRNVSIHAPARGATFAHVTEQRLKRNVSIHAPARGATGTLPKPIAIMRGFNPRARTGRDPAHQQFVGGIRGFNPRARTGRDLVARPRQGRSKCGFNPRARTGRDFGHFGDALADQGVSIHAPARGATRTTAASGIRYVRFQSTRPHGARPCHLTYTYNNANIHPKCDYPA